MRALRSHLSYANVMSSIAVFLVLGGVSYAAATLPRNSVGTKQLRPNSVTRSKMVNGSVGRNELRRQSVTRGALATTVRSQLAKAGAPGPRGPAGPAGPGAKRIHWSARGSANPAKTTILSVGGVTLSATCAQTANGTQVSTEVTSSSAATFYDLFSTSSGPDASNPSSTDTGSFQLPLAAGQTLPSPGPEVDTGFFRAFATVHLVTASSTVTINAVQFVDGDADRCSFAGTAVAA